MMVQDLRLHAARAVVFGWVVVRDGKVTSCVGVAATQYCLHVAPIWVLPSY